MKYRIQETVTTISGFADSEKKKKINANRDSKHTFYFFFGLRKVVDVNVHERLSNLHLETIKGTVFVLPF
jgi:hypothetical protein